jgi:hypothetical protein
MSVERDPLPRPWPFLSPLMDEQDDSPCCECDLTPTMTEVDSDKCAFCGRPIA